MMDKHTNQGVAKAWLIVGIFLVIMGAFLFLSNPGGSILGIMGLINALCLGPASLYLGWRIKRYGARQGKGGK